ncbi:hypothetical protein Tco_0495912 [Tanacetum coccineum]
MLQCSRWKCGILACCGRVQLVQFWNTKDVNVGQSPISITIDPNLGTPNAKLFTGESSRKSVNFFTLITLATNGTHMAVLLESIRAISEQFDNMTYGFFLVKRVTYPIVANYVRNTWDSMLENGLDQAMLEQRLSFRLCGVERYYVGEMPKLAGERLYTRNICVEYEWKPLRCACCKVFGHVQDEFPKKIGSDVAKNLKNPNQDPRGVLVGPKLGYKPVKQVYRHVSKKNNVNTSGNKKKDEKSRKEVSNPNPFDVLNSVENNVDLGTNGRISNLASKETNSSGSSFWNVAYPGDHDGEDEVKPVDNEMASFLA